MMERLSKLTHAAAELLLKAAAVGIALMTVIVGWQVFGRYVLNSSPSWSEQASLTLMIWYVSFAAAAGVREGFHIRIVAFENASPPSVQRIMRLTLLSGHAGSQCYSGAASLWRAHGSM